MFIHKKQATVISICIILLSPVTIAKQLSINLNIDKYGTLTSYKNGVVTWANDSSTFQKFYLSYFSNENTKIVSGFVSNKILIAKSSSSLYFLNPMSGKIIKKVGLNFSPTHILIDRDNLFLYKQNHSQPIEIDALSNSGQNIWRSIIIVPSGEEGQFKLNVISKDKLSIKTYLKIALQDFSYQVNFNRKTGLFLDGDKLIDGILIQRNFFSRMYYTGQEYTIYWGIPNTNISGSFKVDDIVGVDKKGQPCTLGSPERAYIVKNQINILFNTYCNDDAENSLFWVRNQVVDSQN